MQEMQVQSLGQEDPSEKGLATHSSILAWEIPWTEKPGGLQFIAALFHTSQKVEAKCPWVHEWINTVWYMHTMEYYLALKGKKFCHML